MESDQANEPKPRPWLGLFLAALVLALTVQLGRRVVQRVAPARAVFLSDSFAPEFRVGDRAPNFAFPDRSGKSRSLREFSGSDALLCFICGCERCRGLQSFLHRAQSQPGGKVPAVISVTSGMPEGEDAYRRDVPLKQVIVYGDPASPVWTLYRGHPCPRVFRIKGGRVAWISPSPQSVSAEEGALALAFELGIDRNSALLIYRAGQAP
jgi:hypothetical protein